VVLPFFPTVLAKILFVSKHGRKLRAESATRDIASALQPATEETGIAAFVLPVLAVLAILKLCIT